jgi:hypothetical protein
LPAALVAITDLECLQSFEINGFKNYHLSDTNRPDFTLIIQPNVNFISYKSKSVEVLTDLVDNNLNDMQKAIVIDKIVAFTKDLIGDYPHKK